MANLQDGGPMHDYDQISSDDWQKDIQESLDATQRLLYTLSDMQDAVRAIGLDKLGKDLDWIQKMVERIETLAIHATNDLIISEEAAAWLRMKGEWYLDQYSKQEPQGFQKVDQGVSNNG